MDAAIAIAIRRKQEREAQADFRRAGALNPAAAMSFRDLGIDGDSRVVKRLRRRAIIREASPGLFYFDEDVYEAFRDTQRRIALVLAGTLILFFLMVTYGIVTFG